MAIEGLLTLLLCEFFLSTGVALWSQLLSIYYKSIGLDVVNIGLTSTIQGVLSTLTMIPAGIISDRIGRKKPLVVSYFLTFIYVITLIFVRNFYAILLITALYGVSLGLRGIIVSAYVVDSVSHNNRGMAFASVSFFQLFARIIATTTGSFIANSFGFISSFQLSAIILLATIFLAAYLLQESVSIKEISRNDINRISLLESTSNAFRLLRDRNMLFLLVGATIHQWGMRLVFPFLSLYANTVLGFSLVMTGLLLNARTIGDVAGQLPIGKLIDRFGGEFALFLHVFLTAPIIYFYTLTNDFFLIFIIFLIWGSEAGWDMPSRRLLIIKFSKGVGTATALGYIQAFIGFVSLPAPTIGGWIWDKFNPTTVFQVGAIVNVFGCIPLLILLLKAKREKRSLAS